MLREKLVPWNSSLSRPKTTDVPLHYKKTAVYIGGYFVASFPHFNGTGSVYICIHVAMWARALLFRRFTNTNIPGSVKKWKTRHRTYVDMRIFLVRDVIYTSCAYATMSVSVCLSVCLWRKCIGAL